jgi:hypothetical protein
VLAVSGSVCVLGALKVAIFAATLGNVRPAFSSGFYWASERTIASGCELILNGFELINIGPEVTFIAHRLKTGYEKASESEVPHAYTFETPRMLRPLDTLAKDTRIDNRSSDRQVATIFRHYLYSLGNIPLNLITGATTAVAAVALNIIFAAKVVVYACTNIAIPIPTYVERVQDVAIATFTNVGRDIATNFADTFVLLYKTSQYLSLYKVIATVGQLLRFIPQAIFS